MSEQSDASLAATIAEQAGQLLLQVREAAEVAGEQDQRAMARAGDREAQAFIAAQLTEHRPDDVVLSEEAKDDLRRLTAPRVWIIDPLDGTKEYSQGRHDWAVHVALWQEGELVAGAVALPGLETTLRSDEPPTPPQPDTSGAPLRFAVSRSHPSETVTAVIEASHGVAAPMGSAGYKVCAVVRGEADAYVHAGGQFEWDSAAPVAVARAAGLFTSRLDGSRLEYNQRDVYLPDLIICAPQHAQTVQQAVATAAAATGQ